MSVAASHQVKVQGVATGRPLVLVHGFGCDQTMWHRLVPHLVADYQVISYDQAGAGAADPDLYDAARYSTLDGYAEDLVTLCAELELSDVVVVGHSVSAMIGVIAHLRVPTIITGLVLIGPSPRYVDDPPYVGGFSAEDIDDLLASLASNYLGWSEKMAPAIMGRPDEPAYGQELTASFCRTDPDIARRFAEVTFRSDTRELLPDVSCPTLVLQCSRDLIAPELVGRYVSQQIPRSRFVMLDATGHCPQLSAAEETAEAVLGFLADNRHQGYE